MEAGSSAPSFVEVDGHRFAVRLGGPGEPLEVEASNGERALLLPWRLDDHIGALDRHVDAGGVAVRFDHQGFAADVLARSGVSPALAPELAPLALWWAMGGEERVIGHDGAASGPKPQRAARASREVEEGWIDVGRVRASIRQWSFSERQRARAVSTTARPDGAKEFRLATYLRAMLDASVVALDPPDRDLLEGATAAALLDAVAALNASGDRDEDRLVRAGGDSGRALAAATLRICRALGWTPSQVWAAPAPEIDRILALLDVTEPATSSPRAAAPRRPSLADHPDAVIIRVEDDA